MRRALAYLVSFVAVTNCLVSLPGCARFHSRPLSAEKARADFESRTLSDPGLKVFLETNATLPSWPPVSWNITNLTLAAFYFHPDLDVARAQLLSARASRVAAGERPNPSVSWSPEFDTTTAPLWILGVNFDIPIETMGKRGHRIAQATHLSTAARLHLAETAWQVRSRVRKRLLAIYAAEQTQTLLKKLEAIQSETARLLEAQLEAGAVSAFEVTQSRIALNQTRFALLDAQKETALARLQLADALGVPPSALGDVSFDFESFKQFPAAVPEMAARRQALVSRADILAALAEYAAAESALELEIAKQYPNVHLSPGYQLDQTDNKWALGLTVELPILSHNQGAIAAAEAKRTELASRFNALQARVLSELEQAIAAYRAAVHKAEAAGSLTHELETQLRTAQGMLEAGEISRVELAQRQVELTTALVAQRTALLNAQEALGALEDALQSPAGSAAVPENSPRTQAEAVSRGRTRLK